MSAVSTRAKSFLNEALSIVGLRIEGVTAERRETERLRRVSNRGRFSAPVLPLPATVGAAHTNRVEDYLLSTAGRDDASRLNSDPRFDLANSYFSTPDAEVLIAVVGLYRPRRIIEVGSGNSTLLFRIACEAHCTDTQLTSIDPQPRRAVDTLADQIMCSEVEDVPSTLFQSLRSNDILFIDSSHEIKVGNDVVRLFLEVLPALQRGVVIHIHDIFLPYEYPLEWIVDYRWNWTEQYLLQAMLQGCSEFEVIWPGHYLQRTRNDFAELFPLLTDQVAKSFWMVKV